jgi:hypothetical protein
VLDVRDQGIRIEVIMVNVCKCLACDCTINFLKRGGGSQLFRCTNVCMYNKKNTLVHVGAYFLCSLNLRLLMAFCTPLGVYYMAGHALSSAFFVVC